MKQYKIKTFRNSEGCRILVGQDDASNDYLSLKLAGQSDTWFHVSGVPGSHVVLQCEHGNPPPKGCLADAASLAAWYSKMRQGGTVTVNYCPASAVRKPRGAKPGSVTIAQARKIRVRPASPENFELEE